MIIIHHLRDLSSKYQNRPSVITLGVFDGVHIAHQVILHETVKRSRRYKDGQSVVYTFNDHPLKVLKPESAPLLLVHDDEKNKLIEKCGIDILVNETFTYEFSQTPPDKFVQDVICKYLDIKEIIVGHDHGFGKNASGNVDLLRNLGKKLDFTVDEIMPIQIEGKTISSSYLRELLLSGEVSLANQLLGRPHLIVGKVIEGYHRGRTLGYPTANLMTEHEVVPGRGVYAVKVELDNNTFHGRAQPRRPR